MPLKRLPTNYVVAHSYTSRSDGETNGRPRSATPAEPEVVQTGKKYAPGGGEARIRAALEKAGKSGSVSSHTSHNDGSGKTFSLGKSPHGKGTLQQEASFEMDEVTAAALAAERDAPRQRRRKDFLGAGGNEN